MLALGSRNQRLSRFWLTDQAGEPADPGLAGQHVVILHGEDDFVNMLVHVLGVFGMTSRVVRHEDYEPGSFDGADLVIVGPGPGDPREGDHPKIAAFRRAVDDLLASGQPFLAVCLGHQTLCQRLGLELGYKDVVFQGTQSPVRLDGRTERVGFYNTFVGRAPADGALPDGVRVEADEATGDIHAVIGPHFRGIQFHAESILTENGYDLLHAAVRDLLSPAIPLEVESSGRHCFGVAGNRTVSCDVTLVSRSGPPARERDGGQVRQLERAWVGLSLLALMACGATGAPRPGDDVRPSRVTGKPRSPSSSPPRAGTRAPTWSWSCSTTSRWTSSRRCGPCSRCAGPAPAIRTPSSPTRCAASRDRASSPGSTPTRPGCAPTPRTRVRRCSAGGPPSTPTATPSAPSTCGCSRRATRPGSSASSSTSTSGCPARRSRRSCRAGRASTPSSARPTTAGTSPARPWSTSGCRSPSTRHPRPSASAAAKDRAYAGTVIGDRALDLVAGGEAADAPYFLEVALYAPHNRTQPEGYYPGDPLFPPMFRDREGERSCGRVACSKLTVDDLPGYGDPRADNRPRTARGGKARAWNTTPTLPAAVAVRDLRDRARMAQSADRLVTRILRSVGPDTYVVLTSDNGFHLGQNGMGRGKGTPYDTDVRVPLLITGPGVVPGPRKEVTSNIDLAPTFEELAGLRARALPQRHLAGADPRAAGAGASVVRLPRAHAADAHRRRPRRGLRRLGAGPDPVLHRGAQPERPPGAPRPRPAAGAGRRGATSSTTTGATPTRRRTTSPTPNGATRSRC